MFLNIKKDIQKFLTFKIYHPSCSNETLIRLNYLKQKCQHSENIRFLYQKGKSIHLFTPKWLYIMEYLRAINPFVPGFFFLLLFWAK